MSNIDSEVTISGVQDTAGTVKCNPALDAACIIEEDTSLDAYANEAGLEDVTTYTVMLVLHLCAAVVPFTLMAVGQVGNGVRGNGILG